MSQSLQTPQVDAITLKGGLDQITPSITLPSGVARQSLNFEASVTGGYTRILGYERYDGHPSPADSSASEFIRYILAAVYPEPVIGDVLTFTSGGQGTVAYTLDISEGPLTIALVEVTGDIGEGYTEIVTNGVDEIGTVQSNSATPSIEYHSIVKNAVADFYRASIEAVPGSGPVRGIVEFKDTKYAFRDDILATSGAIYKSSAAGWVEVPLYQTVSFTAGGTAIPADGDTLTQGLVTAVIKRVVRTSGAWDAGDAAGQLVIEAPTGGNFSAAGALAGTVPVTLSGAESDIVRLPGGRCEFEVMNFGGQQATERIYGCDGVNQAFEFDGDVLVPIHTGTPVDTPAHMRPHKKYLFLFFRASAIHSAPGLPYDFTSLSGASEIAVGEDITGAISMPGGTNTSTLGICSRNNTYILYGTSPADWNLISYNTGTGAIPYTMQNMAQTFLFDDRGVNSLQTSLQYGNFTQSTLTNSVLPFINERINKCTAATLCRRKSQYRIFFSDGSGMFITVVNNKLLGCMPVSFPDPVTCTYEGKLADGTDVIYFGSDNGMVYQMEKGTSFDGEDIDWFFLLNYANQRSPRTLKRYRKACLEISSELAAFAKFDFAYLLGYDSANYAQPDNEIYSQFTGRSRWDSFAWDQFFWDANAFEPLECPLEGTAENIAFAVSGTSDYIDAFTINTIITHYSPRRMMR